MQAKTQKFERFVTSNGWFTASIAARCAIDAFESVTGVE